MSSINSLISSLETAISTLENIKTSYNSLANSVTSFYNTLSNAFDFSKLNFNEISENVKNGLLNNPLASPIKNVVQTIEQFSQNCPPSLQKVTTLKKSLEKCGELLPSIKVDTPIQTSTTSKLLDSIDENTLSVLASTNYQASKDQERTLVLIDDVLFLLKNWKENLESMKSEG